MKSWLLKPFRGFSLCYGLLKGVQSEDYYFCGVSRLLSSPTPDFLSFSRKTFELSFRNGSN